MKQTNFHVFIPKGLCERRSTVLDVSARMQMSQHPFVFGGGGAHSSIKHLNENSEGEEKSSQIAVKYRSLLPPYQMNV